jgi:hypothetical protein
VAAPGEIIGYRKNGCPIRLIAGGANPTATFTATFTTAGTFTWVAPAGVSTVSVQCWGGGGGGAGGGSQGNGAGGGGEYATELTNTVVAGDSYTVTVGAAGTAPGGSNGGAGGNSSFSGTSATTVTAHGGGAGVVNGGSGSAGGTGSSNSVHYNGGAGSDNAGEVGGGGGGGGSGGTSGAGNSGGAPSGNTGGSGAVAVTGGGPGGNGSNGTTSASNGSAPSSGPGGGGGGSGGTSTGTPSGGTGYAGQVVITWTMASPATIANNTASGTWQWTAPTAVSTVNAQCWAAGGGGGGAGSNNVCAGAGGGGEYAAEPADAVIAGTAYTFTVGAAGTAGASANGNGGAGGNSTFTGGTTVTANGGSAGTGGNNGAGGAGGTGSSNTAHENGGAGAAGVGSTHGGGGGGSGAAGSAGNAGSGSTGGSAVTGGGPGGNGGASAPNPGSAPASGPGGGGGGAFATGTSEPGGAGYDGQVTLTWSGASPDQPTIQPGPTWLDTFKPWMPKPRPPVTPVAPQNYITLLNNAEGGTVGATPAASGSSTVSAGNGWDVVSTDADAFVTYDNSIPAAHGALSYNFSTNATGGTVYLAWTNQLNGQALVYFRQYLYFTATPSVTHRILSFDTPGSSSNGYIEATTSNKIQFFDSASSQIAAYTAGIPLNQWFRIEGWISGSPTNGQGSLSVFLPLDSTTAVFSSTSAATFNTTGPIGQVRFGIGSTVASAGPFWMDDIGVSTSGYLGPANPYNFSDTPQVVPGPAWRHQFKTLRPPAPPSGPYFGNQPNPSDVNIITPGPTWLSQFKRGLPKPRAVPGDNASTPKTSMGLAPMGMSATCNVSPWFDAAPALAPMHMSATAKAGNIATASMALAPMKLAATDTEDFNATAHPALAPMAMQATVDQGLPFPQAILSLQLELLINGTWTDITDYTQQRANIVITRGRADETTSAQPCQMTLTLNNTTGNFTPLNPYGAWYGYIGRNTEIRLSCQNGANAVLSEPVYRFWGEISEWPPLWDQTGSDVYVQLVASGILRRLNQSSESNVGSTLFNYYDSLSGATAPVAWWQCTDASGSTQFASSVPDGDAMTWTGTPSLAADSTSFGGSDPVAQFTGSVWTGDTPDFGSSGDDVFSTPGTYEWTASQSSIDCRTWGGGGPGAAGTSSAAGGGGGGGEYAEESTLAVTIGNTYTVTVGAGGAPGTAGSNSSFPGDSKTVTAHGGGAASGESGGEGGTGSSNTTHHNGGAGSEAGGSGGDFEQNSFITTTPGEGSWDAPSDLYGGSATVYLWAGGGGGGGGVGGGSPAAGGGGAGGNFNYDYFAVTAGNSYSYTIAAGAAGGGNNENGTTGAASQFIGDDETLTVHGGDAGVKGSSGGSGGSHASDSGGQGPMYGGNGGGLGGVDGGGGGGAGGLGGDGGGGAVTGGGSGGGSGGLDVGGGQGGNGGTGIGSGADGLAPGGGGAGGAHGSDSTGGSGHQGRIEIYWTEETSDPTVGPGGGGGSSGGSSAAGNAGSAPVGGTAPVNGGSGGSGGSGAAGSSGDAPGGGGGGGDAGGTPVYAGANGAAGQVQLIYTPATVPTVNVFRFLLNINSSGETDGTVVAEMFTGGTVAKASLVYHTAGTGSFELYGYNSGSSQIFDSGSQNFGANGLPMMVSVELGTSGSDVTWKLTALDVATGDIIATYDGSVTGTVGNVSEVVMNPGGGLTQTSCGQITVQYALVALTDLADVVSAYDGELAGDRFLRLCDENGITGNLVGEDTDTGAMGPQQNQPLLTLFQQIEDFDRGLLFEPRDALGLSYRTLLNMQAQSQVATLDYSSSELAAGLAPTYDDQYIRNDVTVTRINGSSSRQYLATGSMSVNSPPNGVGDYVFTISINAYEDSQLASIASWILSVGTVDDYRYPSVPIDLSRPEMTAIFTDIVTVDVGDFFEITTPPMWLPPGPLLQLAYGFTETLNAFIYTIEWNAVPESPYGST